MKKIIFLLAFAISANIYADQSNPTDDDAVAIVENTATDMEADAKKTLEGIFTGTEKYWPRKDLHFYVFIMDENARVLACPLLRFMGHSYKGQKDAKGKAFRDETIKNALKNKEGWTTFSIRSRGKIKKKKTYFKLVKGSDNKNYIVCCDIDVKEKENNK